MRVLKKMSFDALIENISIEDMKFIMAGSGSVINGSSYTQQMGGGGSGNMGYYATDKGLSSQFSPAGTLLFTPNGDYNNPSISSNQNTYGYGSTNYGSNYNGSYGSGSTGSNTQGWASTGNGIVTTNVNDISRFLNFAISSSATNPNFSWNDIANFLNREQTIQGRELNNATYGSIVLDNVTVINNYKAPSSTSSGINYQNGILSLGILMGSGGGGTPVYTALSGTSGVLLGEQPVNLFADGRNVFNGVADSRSYTVGDGKFTLFAHGAPGFILDEKHSVGIRNATDFDKYMEMMNSNWKNAKDKSGTVLSLWSCQSGTISQNNLSMAQMISLAHPNITVTGADGFVNYGEKDGLYRITGIDTVMDSGKNDGAIVAYKNGVEVYRRKY
ncbi:hypothetical protein [Flavobacterium sp. F52]|uniref:hypothetical protein n=1 Tax=Flavobacterium sp. F52 TaxID=1202532 RepID=UPI000272FA01|nr:hypothetical protein [Flavobacterium sp. F52]EJG02893.1 hypothetical protein FF52_01835 [Flavobacterium sp. F52]